MTSRLLQALGVALVLVLIGGAAAGLLVVKDRVRVVVTDDDRTPAPDPVAMLRDDVATLARDVAALPDAMRAASEQLDARAAARHEQLRAAMPDFIALTAEVAALRRDLESLRATVAAPPGAAPPPPAARVEEVPPAPEPAVTAPAPAPHATVGTASPPKNAFLSFTLPSARFRFDEPQDYTLVPELSRIGFDGKSTLHDFSGVTSKLRGSFRADFDDPDGAWSGEVVVAAATLVTGVDGRDEGLREHLATAHHADIRFVLERFVPAEGGVDVAQRKARGQVRGTMTIRGTSRPFTMPIAVEVDPQQRVVLTGQAPLKLPDYGVPVPSQLGLINMQEEVVVWIALRARAGAGGRK